MNANVHLSVRIRSKRYLMPNGTREVIRNLALDINQGEILAVLGPSGSGKTTMLRIIAGLDPEYDGSLFVSGKPITGPSRERGVVFQEPRLYGWRSVADNVAFALPREMRRGERHSRVSEILERVGLSEFAEAWPYQLSGGMERRVALARALVNTPPILLLDEPFAGLDVYTKHGLHDLLLALCAQSAMTILLITHDVEEAVYLGDRVALLAPPPTYAARIESTTLQRPRARASEAFLAKQSLILALSTKLFSGGG